MTMIEAVERGRRHAPEAAPVRPSPPPMRFQGVDGMRGLAATGVVLYHLWLYASDKAFGVSEVHAVLELGGIGVGVFFSLSGLLLYRPFAAHLLGMGDPVDLRRYGRGRLLRIMPAYWFVLAVVGVLFGASLLPGYLTGSGDDVGRLVGDPVLLLSNVAMVQSYHPSTFLTGIGPSWTLAVDTAFYLVLPVIVGATSLVFRGQGRRMRLVAACTPPALLLLLGVGVKVVLEVDPATGGWDRSWTAVVARSFLGHADLFAFGMMVGVIWHLAGDRLAQRRWRPWALLAAVAIMGSTALFSTGDVNDPITSVGFSAASAIIVATVVLAGPSRSRMVELLDSKVLASFGLLSYSLYLCHEPVIHWLNDRGVLVHHGGMNFLASWVLVLAISIPFAAISYHLIERPALRLKAGLATSKGARRRAQHRAPVAAPAAALLRTEG